MTKLKSVGGTPIVVRFVMDDRDSKRAKQTLQHMLEGMLQQSLGTIVATPEILGTEAEIIGNAMTVDQLSNSVHRPPTEARSKVWGRKKVVRR
jgi:hypothetical protein